MNWAIFLITFGGIQALVMIFISLVLYMTDNQSVKSLVILSIFITIFSIGIGLL